MYNEYDFEELKKKFKNDKLKSLTQEEFNKMIPFKSLNCKELEDFYNKTGITICHYVYDHNSERTLFFNRLGAYPYEDLGEGFYLYASGEYAKEDRDIKLEYDIYIESRAIISQTYDGKNYVIIPDDIDIPEGDIRENDSDQFNIFHIKIMS